MTRAGFEELSVETAICSAAGERRATARRIWTARLSPNLALLGIARSTADRCPQAPGRVHSLGGFEDAATLLQIAARLPTDRALRLRERLEWYACRGAGFHNDAHFAGTLFGAWCVAGPPREIVFPRAATRARAGVGDLVIFDPFEPHAVLDPGQKRYAREHFAGAAPSLFIGFEIELDAAAKQAFGIDQAPAAGANLSSSVPVNAETGALS
jgi:hypothetical protein